MSECRLTLSAILMNTLRSRNWERNPRKGSLQPKWLHHRFPIKGGKTYADIMFDQIGGRNSLLAALTNRTPLPP